MIIVLTRLRIELTICGTLHEHANHYTIEVVLYHGTLHEHANHYTIEVVLYHGTLHEVHPTLKCKSKGFLSVRIMYHISKVYSTPELPILAFNHTNYFHRLMSTCELFQTMSPKLIRIQLKHRQCIVCIRMRRSSM
jgi:hypothetical protein